MTVHVQVQMRIFHVEPKVIVNLINVYKVQNIVELYAVTLSIKGQKRFALVFDDITCDTLLPAALNLRAITLFYSRRWCRC